MKQVIIAAMFLIMSTSSLAQQDDDTTQSEEKWHTRYGAWYTPPLSSTVIDGVAAGFYAAPYDPEDRLVINGVSVEADPLPLLASFFWGFEILIHSPQMLSDNDKAKKDSISIAKKEREKRTDDSTEIARLIKVNINGLSISGGTFAKETEIKGVAINVAFSLGKEMKGLEISGVGNVHYSFHGVIAGLFNHVKEGHGLQVGLYNYCRHGKVVQIGILNKCGKHTTPIIGCNFKKNG